MDTGDQVWQVSTKCDTGQMSDAMTCGTLPIITLYHVTIKMKIDIVSRTITSAATEMGAKHNRNMLRTN